MAACLADAGRTRALFAVETAARARYSDASFSRGDALLFGPEKRGLPAAVLERVPREQRFAIPMRAGNRSLNLSNAVALVVYEAWRQHGFAGRGQPAIRSLAGWAAVIRSLHHVRAGRPS